MRSSRLSKYRKKHKKLIMITQIAVICYAVLFSASLLTSSTVAYFSNNSQVNTVISSAGNWWDGSDLYFSGNETVVNKACVPTEIAADIKNKGETMTGPTPFEVYYSEKNGNPSKNGEIIFEGSIEAMEAGKTSTITHEVAEEGWYVFKAEQRPEYDGDKGNIFWSEKIKVQCNGSKSQAGDDESKEQTEADTSGSDESTTEKEGNNQTDKNQNDNKQEENSDSTEKSQSSDEADSTEEAQSTGETDTPEAETEDQSKKSQDINQENNMTEQKSEENQPDEKDMEEEGKDEKDGDN